MSAGGGAFVVLPAVKLPVVRLALAVSIREDVLILSDPNNFVPAREV